MWCSGFLLAALTVCVAPVRGYSNGKVYPACGDMVPQHGYEPSPDPPPYIVIVDKSTFSPGDNITSRQRDIYCATITRHVGSHGSLLLFLMRSIFTSGLLQLHIL